MDSIVLAYFTFVFVASLGVLQIAAERAKLRGLLFFKWPTASYLFSTLAIGGAFWWFFSTVNLKMRHAEAEGAQQLGLFLAAIIAAFLATAIISSLVNLRLHQRGEAKPGLEALKRRTYLQALSASFRRNMERR